MPTRTDAGAARRETIRRKRSAGPTAVGAAASPAKSARLAARLAQETKRRKALESKLHTSERRHGECLDREIERRRALQAELDSTKGRHGELLERSQDMEARLRRISHKLLSAQEEERMRISRDLHDAIGQTLTGINVGLAALKNQAAADSRGVAEAIALTQQLVERSMKTVHQFAWELRPTLLDDLGLVPALRSYAKTFEERTGVKVRFVADEGLYPLDDDRRTALFRVAQGALLNVERHARAEHARVILKALPGALRLEVRDDGRSFDVAQMETSTTNKHLGLLVMRERIEMVGGTFSIESSPARGTAVRADVPLGDAPAA
jgi:signal transduction histidine kinase